MAIMADVLMTAESELECHAMPGSDLGRLGPIER